MPHLAQKFELRWPEWVLMRKDHVGSKESTFVHRIRRTDYEYLPFVDIAVVH